ncbi:MAG: ferritin family protein [Candidatus Omnitrophota bacterium]|nr:MAG: ferritin family protein [Candidatus Omnitrophota bacterium]
MANIFSPQEILNIAVKVEEAGEKFYEMMERKAKDEKLKAMWKYLKEQEQEHRKIFKAMYEDVASYVVYEYSSGQYDSYLNSIACEYIFTQELIAQKLKEKFDSSVGAIEFGIYIEKGSILTYSALKKYIVEDKQGVIDKVISEEEKHLTSLVEMKSNA